MFSRISRLKLPCFAPKYAEKIDAARVKNERRISENSQSPRSQQPLHRPLHVQSDADEIEADQSLQRIVAAQFDKKEALKVGVLFMLIINSVLLLIATAFLVYQGALHSIWILFLSMIVGPTLCSLCWIWLWGYLIDHHVDICRYLVCCCRDGGGSSWTAKRRSQNGSTGSDVIYMDLDDFGPRGSEPTVQ